MSFIADQQTLRNKVTVLICFFWFSKDRAFISPRYIDQVLLLNPAEPNSGLCRIVRGWLIRFTEPYVTAIDKEGNTVDYLLTKKRKRLSAQSFLIKAIENNGKPELINIDKSGANTAAIKVYNKRSFSKIEIRQCTYLNNIVEQDHRFMKRLIRPGLGFGSYPTAWRTIQGYETMHMIRKGQIEGIEKGDTQGQNRFIAELFGLST